MTVVSVVVATYNHGRYVAGTLADVLAQEEFGGELEVVVVDDGSTDDTEEALAPLRDRIASFRADPELAMSYGNEEFLTAEGEPTGELALAPGIARSGSVFEELLARNFVSGHTPLARRSLVLEVGGFDESPALKGVEDYALAEARGARPAEA